MSMESVDNWYFTKAQLELSPSKKCGIDSSKELSYRQQAANFIQDMGQRLQVSQLCINTAIVYMHRFYVFHSFSKIHRNAVSVCALFLAAKVEEQPRKLEHVIKVSHLCLHREDSPLDVRSELYMEKQLELVTNENIMLQTLGFVIGIEHPHTYVVKLCQLVKASKDLAQTSYFMATNSLHLTTMCLQYKPTVVACVCIHLACKWSNWKIEPCSEGKEWFYYVDKHVTLEQLEALTKEFLAILEKCPNRLKRRVVTSGAKDGSGPSPKKLPEEIVGRVEHQNADVRVENIKKEYSPLPSSSATFFVKKEVSEKPVEVPPTAPIESTQAVPCSPPNKKLKLENPHISLAVYREKRERLSEQKNSALAHQEMPSSSTGTPKLNATDKHFVANHEKRHPKPHAKPGEFVPHRTSEKSHNRHTVTNSHVDSASTEKINHHSPRMPPVVTLNKDSSHPRGNAVKHVTENSKGSDPFVLLTRVDQPVAEKKMFHQSETNQYPAPPSLDLKSSDIVREEDELKSRALNSIEQTINVNPCDNKSLLKAVEPLLSLKVIKQQKPKIVSTSLHNNHADSQPLSQGNPQSPTRDSAKANGTKVLESTPVNHRLQSVSEVNKIVDKNLEAFNKHDRREKHRHKHSVHSTGKDKISNHTTELPGDQNISGGIKITIPKDKIVLSGVRQDSSQKSNSAPKGECPVKKPLKIKISKPKTPETPTVVKPTPPGTGLKLVFTKDKTNAGSYSTSHKGERSSRKRDRSPKVPEQNSRSSLGSTSGKSSKVHKLEGASSKVGVTAEHNKLKRNSHHLEEPHHNAVAMKQPKMGMAYHQPNDVTQQPYSVPYGMPNFYQNYFPYQIPPTANMPYGHLQPPPPPHTSAAPPLPRDPPPPLPPQPPLPSE